jgi:hypothetical protein
MISRLKSAVCPKLVAALLLGLCPASLAQDYILAAPGSEPQATSGSKGANFFKTSVSSMARAPHCRLLPMFSSEGTLSSAYRQLRLPLTLTLTSALLRRAVGC